MMNTLKSLIEEHAHCSLRFFRFFFHPALNFSCNKQKIPPCSFINLLNKKAGLLFYQECVVCTYHRKLHRKVARFLYVFVTLKRNFKASKVSFNFYLRRQLRESRFFKIVVCSPLVLICIESTTILKKMRFSQLAS